MRTINLMSMIVGLLLAASPAYAFEMGTDNIVGQMTVCTERADLDEIISAIKRKEDGYAVYMQKPTCDTRCVLVTPIRQLDEFLMPSNEVYVELEVPYTQGGTFFVTVTKNTLQQSGLESMTEKQMLTACHQSPLAALTGGFSLTSHKFAWRLP